MQEMIATVLFCMLKYKRYIKTVYLFIKTVSCACLFRNSMLQYTTLTDRSDNALVRENKIRRGLKQ